MCVAPLLDSLYKICFCWTSRQKKKGIFLLFDASDQPRDILQFVLQERKERVFEKEPIENPKGKPKTGTLTRDLGGGAPKKEAPKKPRDLEGGRAQKKEAAKNSQNYPRSGNNKRNCFIFHPRSGNRDLYNSVHPLPPFHPLPDAS